MNKPLNPVTSPDGGNPGYEDDAHGWSIAQAAAIRERRLDAIDWDNVAEEIEDVGRAVQHQAESALRVALMPQLKWRYQPLHRSGSWAASSKEHLNRFDRLIRKNPGLKSSLGEMLADAYQDARYGAARETGLLMETFSLDPPSWDEIRAPLEP